MARTNRSTPTLDRPTGTPASPVGREPHPLTGAELALIEETAANGAAAAESGPPAPTLTPPGTVGSTPAAGVWVSGQKVTALWADAAPRNAWLHLEAAGWKKLAGLGDTGSTAMSLVGAHARATGAAPVLDEDPAGTVATLYAW